MNLQYLPLFAQVLTNIAQLTRNPVLTGDNADSARATTLGRVGELIETAADLAAHGERAYDELKQFDAEVAQLKESGRPLEDADFDRLKAQREDIHAKADEIRARPLPEILQRPADSPSGDMATLLARQQALTGGAAASPAVSSAAPVSEPKSSKPDRINPTLPGAKEAQQKARDAAT